MIVLVAFVLVVAFLVWGKNLPESNDFTKALNQWREDQIMLNGLEEED